MLPLNGRCAMTREERNARRRELDKDPFHHSLTLREAKKRRLKNRDKINALRREQYAKNREKELERGRAWRAANPEKARLSYRNWARKNKSYLRMREKERNADPVLRERKKTLRKLRESTPEGRAKRNHGKRAYWQKIKHTERGVAWKIKYLLIPRWEKLINEDEEAIERYERRCTIETWSLFVKWARSKGLYFDPQKRSRKNGKR